MSASESTSTKGAWVRLSQAAVLAVTVGIALGAMRLVPHFVGPLAVVAGVGILLLTGTLLSELLEPLGLPHLTGYLVAGVVAGPHVLHLVEHDTVARLNPVNTLALALIALAGGLELKVEMLRNTIRSLLIATAAQSVLVLVVITGAFILLAQFIPFTEGRSVGAVFGIGLLWGVLAVSRSPSACLGILSQTRAKGPLTNFSLAFIMSSDVVVLMMLALAMTVARPLILPGAEFSFSNLQLAGYELLGSISVGTTLGVVIAAYLRWFGRQLLLVLVALSFGVTEALNYVHFEPLLTFLSAGFVVQNLSAQGPKLLHAVERTGDVVYVVFFATAGAHLDLDLIRALWPVALGFAALRMLTTWVAARAASRLADDPPVIRRWGWSGLVSQAGLTLGLGVLIERQFPELEGFGSLVVATVAINELIGPIVFKLALDRAGESATEGARERASIPEED